jgi:hypothetical protein
MASPARPGASLFAADQATRLQEKGKAGEGNNETRDGGDQLLPADPFTAAAHSEDIGQQSPTASTDPSAIAMYAIIRDVVASRCCATTCSRQMLQNEP